MCMLTAKLSSLYNNNNLYLNMIGLMISFIFIQDLYIFIKKDKHKISIY